MTTKKDLEVLLGKILDEVEDGEFLEESDLCEKGCDILLNIRQVLGRKKKNTTPMHISITVSEDAIEDLYEPEMVESDNWECILKYKGKVITDFQLDDVEFY